jgi:hypothetical protein
MLFRWRLSMGWTLSGFVLLALGCRLGPEVSPSAPGVTASAAAAPITDIALPELLAIELPNETTVSITPTASPLKELLAAATAGGLQVTHNLTGPVAAGATEVTWTAWAGAPAQSAVRATKTARTYVFPFGQTPVGVSGDDRATVGNQSAKVVRDASGRAHMVWLDAGRPGKGPWVMYRRAAVDPQSGALTWETQPLRLSEQTKDDWNSYPAIAASASAVHVAWVGAGTARYRRLLFGKSVWTIEPLRDTRAPGPGPDYGPSIAVRGAPRDTHGALCSLRRRWSHVDS